MSTAGAPTHLLLYGSLRRGEANFDTLDLGKALHFIRTVKFPGRMYDLGDYPGVVLDRPNGLIVGELFAVIDPRVIARLDAFEGYRAKDRRPYDPVTRRGSLYLRKALQIDQIEAHIYVFNGLPARLKSVPRVPTGEWLKHRRTRGRP